MTETATARRSRITPEREAELYGAVLDLLREVGYDALTMDAVAARTRSSKATLYRQWGGKAELVVEAIKHSKPGPADEVDTGTLHGDMHALMAREDDSALERNSALMRGVAMAIHHDGHLREVFRSQLVEPEMAAFRRVLQRAVDRGEIPADCPALEFLMPMMIGAFAARALIDDQPPTRAYLTSYVDGVVLPAFGAPTR
ncbi:TetR/AcrR family transcriptional regulator [Streptomyces sp. DSM 15324]|uniref:TetR/AcrR family transcriptional regulator n=1 Tax=Streptomyces sp. DSM 15324 TaxID=1739111 RepID=UPI0007480736|nr:TetR/AcrR family transcriptional regulator [Streptomyces sp. DSM 15324]KUO10760.1 TetR family transcriptional regulator [Streptomyces sp. DSM 15324]